MARNRSKNILTSLNTTGNDTIKGSEIRSRKLLANDENLIDQSAYIDPNSSSKAKVKKTSTRRKNLMSYETDDLDSETFQSFPNEDATQNISLGNRMRNTPLTDNSLISSGNFNREISRLKNKRNMILDDNDLVIIQTPIKAEQLKLDKRICMSCSQQLNKVFADLKFYSSVLQSLITLFIIGLISMNVYLAYCNCEEKSQENKYLCLKKCNITIMFLTFLIVNVLAGLLFYYDNYQFKHGGYRPKSAFLMFLIWSGGWIVVWPIFLSLKSQAFSDYKIYSLIASILSVTGPALYLVIRSLI